MSTNRLYDTWMKRIQQLFPGFHLPQRRNLAWLLSGIYLSRSVQLSQIAGQIPGQAKRVSMTRRLSRFLENRCLCVRRLYEPLARSWLGLAAQQGVVRLIIDGTKVGAGHQLLLVGLAYRKRALPIAWTWMPCKKGHSSVGKQLALLAHVRTLIPEQARVLLLGDTEFEAGQLQKQLLAWGWQYVLRQKPNNQVQPEPDQPWQSLGTLLPGPGNSLWMPAVCLTRKSALTVNVLAHWAVGEKQPWLLATNLPAPQATLQAYRFRMWIEEMFGDLKKHGFDLESSHLDHFWRLSRLTLVVALLYLWLLTCGSRTVKNGWRQLVDRRERRDLSLFQIGWRYLERCLVNNLHFSIQLCLLPAPKLSGG